MKKVSRQTNSFLQVKLQQSLTKPDEDECDIRDKKQYTVLANSPFQTAGHGVK